jgi:hypothetical protein
VVEIHYFSENWFFGGTFLTSELLRKMNFLERKSKKELKPTLYYSNNEKIIRNFSNIRIINCSNNSPNLNIACSGAEYVTHSLAEKC